MHILFSRDFMYSILCVKVICKIILTIIISKNEFLSVLYWLCGNRTKGRERINSVWQKIWTFVSYSVSMGCLRLQLFLYGSVNSVNWHSGLVIKAFIHGSKGLNPDINLAHTGVLLPMYNTYVLMCYTREWQQSYKPCISHRESLTAWKAQYKAR